ncbi:hypothetical protein [Capybara microvirus Cap1_SP_228]|nr:hypothetical protein [Capybara microvirus Cap1_SP_228]
MKGAYAPFALSSEIVFIAFCTAAMSLSRISFMSGFRSFVFARFRLAISFSSAAVKIALSISIFSGILVSLCAGCTRFLSIVQGVCQCAL